jgi:DNA modification methylase
VNKVTLSVLDARKSQWKERKRYWQSQGIQSHKGREGTQFKLSELYKDNHYSIFDPTLTEWVYHWYTNKGDTIYDPFCGGSVRGIVAGKMGRNYVGIDIREEQIQENIKQSTLLHLPLTYKLANEEDTNEYDFIFTCPPYWNLEKYSDLPNDLSNMKEDKFWIEYERILHQSVEKLKPNSFMAMVVGDVRRRGDLKQPKGSYILLPHRTIDILSKLGVFLYNDIVYINYGNVVNQQRYMETYRKVGKIHQNLLIFNKGDWKKASNRLKE